MGRRELPGAHPLGVIPQTAGNDGRVRPRRRRGDGGRAWWLDDAEAQHRAAPRSFFIPPIEERRELAVGRSAKLLFAFDDRVVDDVARSGERMWVEVVERCGDGSYVGSSPERGLPASRTSSGSARSTRNRPRSARR